jgi:hypothetical protein
MTGAHPKERWTSRAMILISSSCWVEQPRELVGHTTTTDSRSQHTRAVEGAAR